MKTLPDGENEILRVIQQVRDLASAFSGRRRNQTSEPRPAEMLDRDKLGYVWPGKRRDQIRGWNCIRLIEDARPDYFNDKAYLDFNHDVIHDIFAGRIGSGIEHFCTVGHTQTRRMVWNDLSLIADEKRTKLERFRDVFIDGLPVNQRTSALDTVGSSFAEEVPVSAWGYSDAVFDFLEPYRGGVIVDLGAGFRPEYFDDIINLELGNFITTDVRSFAEILPFKDKSVDCLISVAVFEHVMRPWDVAKEIERVLKPGGGLWIDTAFMAGRHGYPHHYYNMTIEGVTNLFKEIEVDSTGASRYGHSVYSLYWLSRIYRDGLSPTDAATFGEMKIAELLSYPNPEILLDNKPFLRSVAKSTNDDLAFNVTISGRKKA